MGQIFDDIFRTLCEKNSHLLIPLINEAFHKNYQMTDRIELMAGEHHIMTMEQERLNSKITDSAIHIGNKIYHLECQVNPDGTMILRMVEYDFHIALENATKTEWGYEMRFPESAVLYLRHTKSTPDELQMKITFPQNASITYNVPVIKTQRYSEEDIIGKQLFFLIPYYILRYEHINGEVSDEIVEDYMQLYRGMIDARDAGMLDEYDLSNIIDLTHRLVDYIFRENQKIRSEVNAVMGGEVLETYADQMIAKGMEQGIQVTIKMAREFGMQENDLVERLMQEFSLDRAEAERLCQDA